MFCDYYAIKLEINRGRKSGKFTNMYKLSNRPLNTYRSKIHKLENILKSGIFIFSMTPVHPWAGNKFAVFFSHQTVFCYRDVSHDLLWYGKKGVTFFPLLQFCQKTKKVVSLRYPTCSRAYRWVPGTSDKKLAEKWRIFTRVSSPRPRPVMFDWEWKRKKLIFIFSFPNSGWQEKSFVLIVTPVNLF